MLVQFVATFQVAIWTYLFRRLNDLRLILHDNPKLRELPRQFDRSPAHPGANINDRGRLAMLRPIVIVDQPSMQNRFSTDHGSVPPLASHGSLGATEVVPQSNPMVDFPDRFFGVLGSERFERGVS